MAKRRLRQRRAGIGHARDVGVAQAAEESGGNNGVVEISICPRSQRDPIFGQDAPSSSICFSRKLLLVRLGVIRALPGQRDTTGSFARYSSSIQASCESTCRSRQSRSRNARVQPRAACDAHLRLQLRDNAASAAVDCRNSPGTRARRISAFLRASACRPPAKRDRQTTARRNFPLAYSSSLRRQRGHHIERGVHARKFLEHADHAPVVLERVQARPRQHVPPGRPDRDTAAGACATLIPDLLGSTSNPPERCWKRFLCDNCVKPFDIPMMYPNSAALPERPC